MTWSNTGVRSKVMICLYRCRSNVP